MRVVLLNPPLTLAQRYGPLADAGATEPPIGLCYIASSIEAHSIDAAIIDASALGLTTGQAVEAVMEHTPDAVGISAVTVSIHSAGELADAIKKVSPRTPIVIGGVHVSSMPRDTMERFPSFDVGVIGEGEVTSAELFPALEGRGDLSKVEGIIYREEGALRQTPPRQPVKDMDVLPKPGWEILKGFPGLYSVPFQSAFRYPSSSLITSRGCTGKCTFCDRKVFGNYCRKHGAQYIFDMMEELHKKYGIRDIHFEDDNFTTFPGRIEELCRMLINAEFDLVWSAASRPDTVNKKILILMKRAGCRQIQFGIESGCQELLDLVKKGVTLSMIEESVRLAKEAGLETKAFFMLGFPMETKETIERTIAVSRRMDLDDISVTFFTPFPGTEIYADIHKYGTLLEDWSRMTVFEPVFVPSGLTAEELWRSFNRMIFKFYFRPRLIWSYLRRIKSARHFKTMLATFLTLLRCLFRRSKADS